VLVLIFYIKPKKNGIKKERSRSRSFIKPKKKEHSNSGINNNNNVRNNVSDRNNENDTPTTTSTATTPSPTSPPPSPPPSPLSIPGREELFKSNDSVQKQDEGRDIRKSQEENNVENKEKEKGRDVSSNALRESTVFEEERPFEIPDDHGEQDQYV
jgi:hypothetical protein